MKGTRSLLAPYAVALLAVGSALLLTLLLQPLLKPTIFLLFFATVAVSAWYGGMEAGLLATALSTLSVSYFFLEPVFSLSVASLDNIRRLSLFVLVTTFISLLNSELRTAKQHLQMSLQKLKVSEAKFRRLVESNIIGVIVANMDGAIAEANDAFLRMVGYSQEDLVAGRVRWRDMIPPKYIEANNSAIAELKAKGVCQPFENEYIRKDNTRVPILLGSALLENNPNDIISFVLDLSERKQVELALCQSEERYRAFLEQSSEGIWCIELEVPISADCPEDEQIQHFYQYVYLAECNNVMAQMYGCSRAEEIINARLGDFLIPSDPHNIAYLRNFIRSNYRLIDAESHEIDKQGNSKYFLNNLVGIVENGLLVRAWGTQRDITERKRAETALCQREDELRLITNAVPVQISYVDTQQRYRFNNKKYEDWFGLAASEIYGKHIREILGESVYQSILPYVEAVLSGKEVTYETQLLHKDGTHHYVNVSYVPQFSEQGKVKGFVALITDITLHKLAEAALKQSEKRLKTLTEKVRIIPWEVNATTGNFTYIGPQTVEILGYPLSDWYIDDFWQKHMHPEDREWAIQYCQESSLSLNNYEFEYRMLAADGRVVWLYDIVNVVRDENGPQLLHGFMLDITDRKQAEQEREQLLEREKAARADAESANRMKDEFLATLSHELRTPLNAILGWTQLLRNRKFDEATTARALETIERNTRSLTQLIEDVLDVSRIIRGTLHLSIHRIKLVPLVEAAIDTVRPAAEAKEINIKCRFDPEVGVVVGDTNRLQQVVWNLLSNAVKFTPKGGRVDVQLERIESSVQIRVSDTGAGIAAEFLPHVFERFRQADSSSTRSHGGLGLGLAIVRHLVELHGGTVSVESLGVGQGATFIVNLPMKAVYVEANTAEQPSSLVDVPEANNYLPRLDDLRVLIVDDEADARHLLTTILGQYGAQVIAAASACEALLALQQFRPHILVSDIGMPQQDGYALIRQVRALPTDQGGRIPAVALTAYARAEDRTQALLAGFQLHVPKPVNPSELAVVVANLTGRT
ncbi:PAS domain S-box protein [Nostoc sp. UCD121]|uniref:hybrid sensor histidine kinase/response regulator n=1 Tax=unclassified Nostoc TaxID=2593658 RepID=UPI0016278778|nr:MULTISPECIES: PAS domain S-box protein [unclassified Nostoc]MBC1218606.1 PAS domain S-box protein [Nostoc sp. UCD120]MBC1278999.1 PAS domain S-box protein [Nostoc sp. UCD121]MBC1299536.1 PAS domain S-box protein [Nostoc sp. UCD122]